MKRIVRVGLMCGVLWRAWGGANDGECVTGETLAELEQVVQDLKESFESMKLQRDALFELISNPQGRCQKGPPTLRPG